MVVELKVNVSTRDDGSCSRDYGSRANDMI